MRFKDGLGTKTIVVVVMDEKKRSGKVFTKLEVGKNSWQTFTDVNTKTEQLAKVLLIALDVKQIRRLLCQWLVR